MKERLLSSETVAKFFADTAKIGLGNDAAGRVLYGKYEPNDLENRGTGIAI